MCVIIIIVTCNEINKCGFELNVSPKAWLTINSTAQKQVFESRRLLVWVLSITVD